MKDVGGLMLLFYILCQDYMFISSKEKVSQV